jgi:tetratricopeptide (TPR) repeat protein
VSARLAAALVAFAFAVCPAAADSARALLEALAKDPRAGIRLSTVVPPGREDQVAFDAALEATRQAVRADPGDAAAHANLGILLFWRDRLHPGAAGGPTAAARQFAAALEADPAHSATLDYLSHAAVVGGFAQLLAPADLDELVRILRQAADRRRYSPAPRRALLRLLRRARRDESDWRPLAEQLIALVPDSAEAQIEYGSVLLRRNETTEAQIAFDLAARLASAPRERLGASLGLTAVALATGRGEPARAHYVDAHKVGLARAEADAAAVEYGLDDLDGTCWSVAKALVTASLDTRGLGCVSPEAMVWMAEDGAARANALGVRLYEAHDIAGARRAFLEAAELLPVQPAYVRNLAVVSFELDRFAECASAYRQLEKIAQDFLQPNDYREEAMALAVQADYRAAVAVIWEGLWRKPDPGWLRQWLVVFAYGENGWDAAATEWRRFHTQPSRRADRVRDTWEMFDLVDRGLSDISRLADRKRMRYARLVHHSLRYRLLGEAARRLASTPDWQGKDWFQEQFDVEYDSVISAWRALSLKLAVPGEARDLAREAQAKVDRGDRRGAAGLYYTATLAAPWWPEAQLNLALTAFTQPDLHADAWRALTAYLALVPEGTKQVKLAKKKKEEWQALGLAGGESVLLFGNY